MFGTVALLVAWVFSIGLNHLENQADNRSSTYIYAFYIVSITVSAISVRTMHDLTMTGQSQFSSFCVFFGAIGCGFILEAWPRSSIPNRSDDLKNDAADILVEDWDKPTAYDQSNLFSRLTFHFMQHVISIGYCRTLQNKDIANMMPRRIRTVHSYEFVFRVWDRHLQKCRQSNKMPSLLWIVLKAGGWSWAPIIIYALTESVMEFVQPILLDVILNFISSYSTDQPQPTALGLILSVGMFGAAILSSMASGQFFQLGTNLGIELKSGLISMIYRKSLKLSPGARREATSGEITNHMSVDAERIGQAITTLPLAISAPFEIAIGIWLLYRQLGASAFTGLGVVVLLMPVQGLVAKVLNKAKDKKLEAMDGRIRLATDILSGIRAVKLYSWERSFRERLEAYRNTELKHLRHIGITVAVMMIMFTSMPSLMTLLSFVVYSLVGGPNGTKGIMSAQVVFVSITLFNRLSKPIGRASVIISQAISMNVAVKRIQSYLLLEELSESQVEYLETPLYKVTSTPEKPLSDCDNSPPLAIQVHDGEFSWNSPVAISGSTSPESKEQRSGADLRPTLSNINLAVPHGSLTVVMGRVGQGKSSLLSAITGDMYKQQGRIQISGKCAYVPQQAWIINATVRNNIVFGKAFDQEKYDRVLFASGLLPDLEILAAGDQTEIGERGINLSGGQKQRVSLARAAYQDADVYLLDDPLSAVDAHVDQHLWENLIGPKGLLKDKARLLITHGVHHLSEVDHIMIVKDGGIDETGSYADLMAAQGSFFQLIGEYSVSKKKDRHAVEVGDSTGREDSMAIERAEYDNEEDKAAGLTANDEVAREDDNADLTLEEQAAEGAVSWKVFKGYAKAATYPLSFLSILGFILSQVTQIGMNLWLQSWTSQEQSGHQPSIGKFLGVYAGLVFLYFSLDFGVNLTIFVLAGIRASRILHENILGRVLRLPMSFFDTTPIGRIVNRFSSDVDNVDELLPIHLSDFYYFLTSVFGTLIVISVSVPIFMALIPFLVALYLVVQVWYIRSSRSLKRIHSISKSPLYQHFSETLIGASTIRAMRADDRFILENSAKSDKSANAYFAYKIANRWLHMRLEFLGAIIVFATSLLAVLGRRTLAPGMAGLALSYALNITFMITYLMTSFGDLQDQLISVERIQEYSVKDQEAPDVMPKDDKLLTNWPSEGKIVFRNYSTRYRQGMDLVLKNVSFEVLPTEKIGVVGRTGAGKSSLTLALFRIIEAANGHWAKASHNGQSSYTASTSYGLNPTEEEELGTIEVEEDGGLIEIDGVDISTVGLKHLRQRLSIIPQDPTLFAGS
ncbi:Multidrug resistance-associated protein 1, partial [Gamsiella multidivaricata]